MVGSLAETAEGMRRFRLLLLLLNAAVAPLHVWAQWKGSGPYGGAVEFVCVSAQLRNAVLAGTRNALIYRSLDGGDTWEHKAFPRQYSSVLHALAIDPRDARTWYAGTEDQVAAASGLYRTRDAGITWTQLPGLRGIAVWSLAIWSENPQIIAAGAADGLYLTRDGGDSWRKISPDSNRDLRPVVSLAFHPVDSRILYAGTTHLPWLTMDGGVSWQSIHSGMLDDSDVFSIHVDPQRPQTVFSSACSGAYRSLNGGRLWTRMATPRGAFRTYLVTQNPRRRTSIFAATSAGLLKSDNGGAIWRKVSPEAVKSIAFDPFDASRIYAASSTGGLLRSTDGGETFRESSRGLGNHNLIGLLGSDRALFTNSVYEAAGGGLYRSDDFGATWRRISAAGTSAAQNMLQIAAPGSGSAVLFAITHTALLKSGDGGRTWQQLMGPPGSRNLTALAISDGKPAAVLAGTSTGLFRSIDSGTTWKLIPLSAHAAPDAGGTRVEFLQQSGISGVAAITNAGAFFSEDGGAHWQSCSAPEGSGSWYGLAFDSQRDGFLLAATSQGLFRSVDRCASWSPVRDGLDAGTVSIVLRHPKRAREAYAVQYGRVFRSMDGGRHWEPLADEGRNGSYPSALVILPSAPERLFALFPRRGVFFASIGSGDPPSVAEGTGTPTANQ